MIKVNCKVILAEKRVVYIFFPFRALSIIEENEIMHKYGPEVMWCGLWAIEI